MFVNDVFVVGGGGVCLSLFFCILTFSSIWSGMFHCSDIGSAFCDISSGSTLLAKVLKFFSSIQRVE